MDKITIKDLIVHAFIGVHSDEKKAKQPLSIDLSFSVDANRAAMTDSIADTHDYSAIYNTIILFVQENPCELLETLTHRLADHLKKTFEFSWLQLSITKKPSSMPLVSGVTLIIER